MFAFYGQYSSHCRSALILLHRPQAELGGVLKEMTIEELLV
jgi:hypothetical protein